MGSRIRKSASKSIFSVDELLSNAFALGTELPHPALRAHYFQIENRK